MIDAAVAQKLVEVLKNDRVFPDMSWFRRDNDGNPIRLGQESVVMYRQTGGSGPKFLNRPRGSLRTDFFLLEVFADDRDECSRVKDVLLDAFAGPVDPDEPSGWSTWGSPKSPCNVHWAEADEPDSGAEFPDTEIHLIFRYVRMVLSVQWNKE